MQTDYACYRDYVIVALPQLKHLDGKEVTRSERFKAQKNFDENRRQIIQLQVSKINLQSINLMQYTMLSLHSISYR
jgi:hypothetical protein